VTDIGASAWFVEIENHRLLLDAGVHPKREGRESLPMLDLIRDETLDAIAISHCHHDHVGGKRKGVTGVCKHILQRSKMPRKVALAAGIVRAQRSMDERDRVHSGRDR
jgi:metal-dependent hydrolase (beta-lactamase superfamily II)